MTSLVHAAVVQPWYRNQPLLQALWGGRIEGAWSGRVEQLARLYLVTRRLLMRRARRPTRRRSKLRYGVEF
jgi:hypothetical protein